MQALGLSKAANEFAPGARAAGLKVPARFGTEVVARLLGLRTNHPADEDSLELLPGDHATRAEAAYSAAQMLRFAGWEVAAVQSARRRVQPARAHRLADARSSTPRSPGSGCRTSGAARATAPRPSSASPSRGGYDCSGFVWRVYKLEPYPGERLAAARAPRPDDLPDERRGAALAADRPRRTSSPPTCIFFGDRGPRSQPAQVGHMGIYVGNGWFIQSSGYGVALATLDGWYAREFAWARRPLAEAGLVRLSRASRTFEGHSQQARTITPSGDSTERLDDRRISSSGVLALFWRENMLEWKPRLVSARCTGEPRPVRVSAEGRRRHGPRQVTAGRTRLAPRWGDQGDDGISAPQLSAVAPPLTLGPQGRGGAVNASTRVPSRVLALVAPVDRGGGRSRLLRRASRTGTTPHSAGDVAAVVGLFIGMVLAERFPVPVEGVDAGGVTLGFVFAVAAIVLFGWQAGVIVAAGGADGHAPDRHRPPLRVAYNGSMFALAALAGGLAIEPIPESSVGRAARHGSSFCAFIYNWVVNLVLISAVLAVSAGQAVLQADLWTTREQTTAPFALMASAALMLVVLWERSPRSRSRSSARCSRSRSTSARPSRRMRAMRLALTDPLTGLGNHRHFHERLQRELAQGRARRR